MWLGEQMDETKQRPSPRSEQEIFSDLRSLAQSDGALHEISALVYRDWVTNYDPKDGRITNDPDYRFSTERLHKNELMLLVGLMVQSNSDRIYSVVQEESEFAALADKLLRELHDRINFEAFPAFGATAGNQLGEADAIGPLAREAIFYGAENFYVHQLTRFTRLRYRDDAIWLLQNAGMSIRPIIDIATFIMDRINSQMSAIGHYRSQGQVFTNADLTNSLLIAKEDLRKKFGAKADAFIAKFVTPATASNIQFDSPFAVNGVAIAPIIDLGDVLYVANQYRLMESLYESPFYWMGLDKAYVPTMAKNRGAFLEKTTAEILRSVFGKDHVFENVIIDNGTKNDAGEIDVLVLYGEFVLIVQAKSKRVTMKARAGDTDALKADFKGAIQDPYQQALSCANLVKSGASCLGQNGRPIEMPRLPRLFPVVVLSDPFPGATFISRTLLTRGENIAPVIWDLGVLDCIAKMLPKPVDLLFYLQCRAAVFDTMGSDSEYNYLGYHISHKLALDPEADFMMLDRDFATVVDDYMMATDFGIPVARPVGILERLSIPPVTELLAILKDADPRLASVVVDLYDFSSAALEDYAAVIVQIRDEVRATGKAIKAFSIPTGSGGITYAVVQKHDKASLRSAEVIGEKHKYDTKSDRWYVIVDCVHTDNPIDALRPLVYPWEEDEDQAANSLVASSLFNSSVQQRVMGEKSRTPPLDKGAQGD